MGGKYITKPQAKLYMKLRRNKELTQESAAAKVDISIRSGRTIEKGLHHTSRPKELPRHYKTRKSPIDEVWESKLEPMLKNNPGLQPKTLFIHLQRTFLDDNGNPIYNNSIERTLQRKVAKWLALHGNNKEVMFPQDHIPGVQALSDFTHFNAGITISGTPFKHMFYHFRLVYSKWSYLKVIIGGESMQALSEGLQEALFALGGSPKEHRTDSLSAAFKNISTNTKEDLTAKYEDLCTYYSMTPTRNNKGKKHENGSVESSHGHLKNRISQELILRESNDFNSVSEYESWIHGIVNSSNKRNCYDFNGEYLALQKLPEHKTQNYEIKSIKVSNLAIIKVKGVMYSVPSNLSGHTITLHIYQRKVKAYLGNSYIFTFDREKYTGNGSQQYSINYKHVIGSLIKKPAAFRKCKYRNELLPTDNYRRIWSYLNESESHRVAPKIMLRLLKLAAEYNCEKDLEIYVTNLIRSSQQILIEEIERRFNSSNPDLPDIECKQHDLKNYDFIIKNSNEGENYATI